MLLLVQKLHFLGGTKGESEWGGKRERDREQPSTLRVRIKGKHDHKFQWITCRRGNNFFDKEIIKTHYIFFLSIEWKSYTTKQMNYILSHQKVKLLQLIWYEFALRWNNKLKRSYWKSKHFWLPILLQIILKFTVQW